MTQSNLHDLLNISVKKIASLVIRDFSEIEFLLKNPTNARSFANDTNIKIQEYLHKDLSRFKSSYSVLFKNLNKLENQDKSNYFIINGILGMKNFSKGIAHFCISIMLERDKKPFAAIMYNPITNEMFYAEKDLGATFNQKKLRASENNKVKKDPLISTDLTTIKKMDISVLTHFPMISNCKALDICYLAANKIDKCHYSINLPYYNIAPAILIAEEAGVKLSYEINTEKNIITNLISM